MFLRVIAPALLLLAAAPFAVAATAADAPTRTTAKQSTQVSKSANSTNAKAPAKGTGKAAAAPAKPKPPAHDPQATRILNMGGLGEITVYAPQGPARGLALFASGDGNWNLGVWDMAHTASELGYWVAGFSTPAFLRTLEAEDGQCSNASGLLDRIGAKVKTEMKLPPEFRPVLIGYSSGATIMYAALAQAGDTRYGGAMTLGFCPDLIIHRDWCEGAGGLTASKMSKAPYTPIFNTVPVVKSPWIVLQGEIDQVCNPPATEAFVKQVHGGHVVMLPKVGHGYSVPRNWMPQYRQGLIDLLDAAARQSAATAP
jgi:type IV secretory pathway VirJ component